MRKATYVLLIFELLVILWAFVFTITNPHPPLLMPAIILLLFLYVFSYVFHGLLFSWLQAFKAPLVLYLMYTVLLAGGENVLANVSHTGTWAVFLAREQSWSVLYMLLHSCMLFLRDVGLFLFYIFLVITTVKEEHARTIWNAEIGTVVDLPGFMVEYSEAGAQKRAELRSERPETHKAAIRIRLLDTDGEITGAGADYVSGITRFSEERRADEHSHT